MQIAERKDKEHIAISSSSPVHRNIPTSSEICDTKLFVCTTMCELLLCLLRTHAHMHTHMLKSACTHTSISKVQPVTLLQQLKVLYAHIKDLPSKTQAHAMNSGNQTGCHTEPYSPSDKLKAHCLSSFFRLLVRPHLRQAIAKVYFINHLHML